MLEAPYYTIEYFDHTGRRVKRSSRCADKDAAQQLANSLETEAMRRRKGLVDAAQERFAAEGRRSVLEHVEDFRAVLYARGRTPKHVAHTVRHVRRLIDKCPATKVADLTGSAVLQVLGQLRDGGSSLRTVNSHLASIRSFTRWLFRERRASDGALAALSAFNEATDRRHVRRELSPEELSCLARYVAIHGRESYRLSGAVRAMAYRVAVGTGFRAAEMQTLTQASFDLDADPPTITVEAAYSKRRRQDVQPIRPDLADSLRSWLEACPQDTRVFPLPQNTSKMFRRDLEDARAAWIAEAETNAERDRRGKSDFLVYRGVDGRVIDFHSLRHTFISSIVAGGASVKTAQELARHSTPTLTIGRYSHARLHDLTGALDTLPALRPPGDDDQARRATGTEGAAPVRWSQIWWQSGGKTCPDAAIGGESSVSDPTSPERRNTLRISGLGHTRQDVATRGASSGGGTRTQSRNRLQR